MYASVNASFVYTLYQYAYSRARVYMCVYVCVYVCVCVLANAFVCIYLIYIPYIQYVYLHHTYECYVLSKVSMLRIEMCLAGASFIIWQPNLSRRNNDDVVRSSVCARECTDGQDAWAIPVR